MGLRHKEWQKASFVRSCHRLLCLAQGRRKMRRTADWRLALGLFLISILICVMGIFLKVEARQVVWATAENQRLRSEGNAMVYIRNEGTLFGTPDEQIDIGNNLQTFGLIVFIADLAYIIIFSHRR